jgi:hypothetical protein
MHINSYPSIFNLGHKAVSELFSKPVTVEEKVDGSQFSFMVTEEGELCCRSKGADLNLLAPEKMFVSGIEAIKEIQGLLKPGWVYRGEYLRAPKHNTLVYSRVPKRHVILFDINPGLETYLNVLERQAEAERLGMEVVPWFFQGMVQSVEEFRKLREVESVLGGQKIEGVVIKPSGYDLWGPDKKCLMGKFVSEAFKEIHTKAWREDNPTQGDIIQQMIFKYGTPARWAKAVQHLRESGELENSPKDIGKLMKEVPADVLKECREEMLEDLFKWAWDHIRRGLGSGLPAWYKEELVKKQFGEDQ